MLRLAYAVIIAAALPAAQSRAPIATVDAAADHTAVFALAREKIWTSIGSLDRYTCLEDIRRHYYVATTSVRKNSHPVTQQLPPLCAANQKKRLELSWEDRLRIEVAVAREGEIHSWPGARVFDTRSIEQMIPYGPTSTGAFGTSLYDVFVNRATRIYFNGHSGELFHYSYQVPQSASHFTVKGRHGPHTVGFFGTFTINSQSDDLVDVMMQTVGLPVDTQMCATRVATTFHFVAMQDGKFLVPERSDYSTADIDGGATSSLAEFSRCREYTTESTIRFDTQSASAFPDEFKSVSTTPLITLLFVKEIFVLKM